MYGEELQKLLSAATYMIIFFVSCFFTALADQSYEKKNKMKFVLYSATAILIPCILASSRNISVGTDTHNYYEIFTSIQKSASIDTAYQYWGVIDGLSYPFVLLNRMVSKLFGSFSMLLFIYELFAIFPIYIISFYYRDKAPAWVVLFVYYMMFYNTSLNISRQSIAVAFMILSIFLIYKHKYIKTILSLGVACIFHKTFYIGLLPIIYYFFDKHISNNQRKKVFRIFSIIIIVTFVLEAPIILDYLLSSKIISGRGTGLLQIIFDTSDKYIDTVYKGLNKSAYLMILFRFVFIGIQYAFLKGGNISRKDKHYKRICMICFLNSLFYAMVSLIYNTYYVQRITLYLDYYFVLLLPYMYWGKMSKRTDKMVNVYKRISLNKLTFITITFIYWYFAFIYHGYDYTNMYFVNTL